MIGYPEPIVTLTYTQKQSDNKNENIPHWMSQLDEDANPVIAIVSDKWYIILSVLPNRYALAKQTVEIVAPI